MVRFDRYLSTVLAAVILASTSRAQTYCYAENDTPQFNDQVSMGGPNLLLGVRFVAPTDMAVAGMETFTGEASGPNTLAIWSHNASANRPAFFQDGGTWAMDPVNGWQGTRFGSPVRLDAGMTYWVVWGCQDSSQAAVDVPMATPGQLYRFSLDGGSSWSAPSQSTDRHWKFRFLCELATVYCTAKSILVCGTPAMSFSGTSSAGANSGFFLEAGPALRNRLGQMIYSEGGRAVFPFNSGILCVSPSTGLYRSATASSGGANPCGGVFSIDMNAYAQGLLGGTPPEPFLLSVGERVNAQWWGRDSVATGSFLSDAVEYYVGP